MTVPWRIPMKFLAAAGLFALAASCAGGDVRLGVIVPLTGPYAPYGKSVLEGAQVAADAVGRSGGISGRALVLDVKDSASQPARAAALLSAMADAGEVRAVLGGVTSDEALAMEPVARSRSLLLFSPTAGAPSLSGKGPFFFRNWPPDDDEAAAMAEFAAYTLHATEVLVAAEPTPYARGLAGAFAAHFDGGGRAATLWEGPADPSGFEAALPGSPSTGQVLYVAGYGPWVAGLVRALRSGGDPRPILACGALAEESGDWAGLDGVVSIRPARPEGASNPESEGFRAAYGSRFGRPPDAYAASAYDAVRMIAAAASGEGPRDLREGLRAIRRMTGASGTVSFDETGRPAKALRLCVIQGGVPVPLEGVLKTLLPGWQAAVARRRFEGGPRG